MPTLVVTEVTYLLGTVMNEESAAAVRRLEFFELIQQMGCLLAAAPGGGEHLTDLVQTHSCASQQPNEASGIDLVLAVVAVAVCEIDIGRSKKTSIVVQPQRHGAQPWASSELANREQLTIAVWRWHVHDHRVSPTVNVKTRIYTAQPSRRNSMQNAPYRPISPAQNHRWPVRSSTAVRPRSSTRYSLRRGTGQTRRRERRSAVDAATLHRVAAAATFHRGSSCGSSAAWSPRRRPPSGGLGAGARRTQATAGWAASTSSMAPRSCRVRRTPAVRPRSCGPRPRARPRARRSRRCTGGSFVA